MSDKREKLSDIMLGMVEDINPAEIANHIARGNLHEWCERWRETVGKYLSSIGNGVTVQEWIPVSEQPKEKGWYWVYAPTYYGGSSSGLYNINGIMFAKWSGKNWSIEVGYHKRPGCVTHWMPLPEPPKGD